MKKQKKENGGILQEERQKSAQEDLSKLNFDLRERFIFLIDQNIVSGKGGRYKYLEQRYGISARKWKNVCNRVQQPGTDMLISFLKDYSYFATWLMIGRAVGVVQVDPTDEAWRKKLLPGL